MGMSPLYGSNDEGMANLKHEVTFLIYRKNSWQQAQEFCAPFEIEKTKRFDKNNGRAIIDLPSDNEAFEDGMVIVRLGKKRMPILEYDEFFSLFVKKEKDEDDNPRTWTVRQRHP